MGDGYPSWKAPKWFKAISILLVVLPICVVVASWIFVYWFRKTPIVAMGQPEFLYMICFGATLMSASSIFWVFVLVFDEDEFGETISEEEHAIGLDISCNLFVWFAAIGITITSTALLCKVR